LNTGNPDIVHEVPLYDVKVGIWWAINLQRTTGFMFFFHETINSEHCMRLSSFFVQVNHEQNCMGSLYKIMQWHILWTCLWMNSIKSSVNESYIKDCSLCDHLI
jgi:hypothetical protein